MAEDSLLSQFQLACEKSPEQAISELDDFLARSGSAEPEVGSEICRLASLAARALNRPDDATVLSERALGMAAGPDLSSQYATAGMTHSYHLFLIGRVQESLELVQSLDPIGDEQLGARIVFQHATILARTGDSAKADSLFAACGTRARRIDDLVLEGLVEKNRGMLAAQSGRHQIAVERFTRTLEIFEQLDDIYQIAYAKHSLGIAAMKVGDLPGAFRYFNEGEGLVRELAGSDFELKRSRCEALTVAGLFTEAAEVAEDASRRCLDAGLVADAAEIGHMAAAAWLDAGRPDAAFDNAVWARDAFEQQSRSPWAAAATLIALEADVNRGESPSVDAIESAIAEVEAGKLEREAVKGKLLLARVHLEVGDLDRFGDVLEPLQDSFSSAAPDLVLATHLLKARAHDQGDDRDATIGEADRGFDVLAGIQSKMGSPLLRSSVSQHALELGRLALRSAVASRKPLEVWSWMERIAVSSSTPRPISPPDDVGGRAATRRLRSAADSSAEIVELETTVRDADFAAEAGVERASSTSDDDADPFFSLAPSTDSVVLSFGIADDVVYGCSLVEGNAELTVEAELADIARSLRALRADQRRWVTNPERAKPDRIISQLQALDDRLLAGLPDDPEEVVVVAPPGLFSLPWTALPSLRGRTTTVVSSLTSWLQKSRVGAPASRLLAAGPDLLSAGDELDSILANGANHDVALVGADATVDAVLNAMDGVDVAHLMAHGTTKSENPLFSNLQFADGRLNVYELGAMVNPPKVVVLSACNVGMTSESAATTMLGMVTGLLHAGTDCVIASPIPVSDSDRLSKLMAAFHREWLTSTGPAAAWSAIQGRAETAADLADAATFCVYGRG